MAKKMTDDEKAFEELQGRGAEIKEQVDRIVESMKGKNQGGIFIAIGYLESVVEALKKA